MWRATGSSGSKVAPVWVHVTPAKATTPAATNAGVPQAKGRRSSFIWAAMRRRRLEGGSSRSEDSWSFCLRLCWYQLWAW